MSKPEMYRRTKQGGFQLGADSECWHVEADYIDLSPNHRPRGTLLRIDSDEMPIVEDTARMALIIVDMQNDFCSKGGWADQAGFDTAKGRQVIPGIERTIAWARQHSLPVIWVVWASRHDLQALSAPTLYQYKKTIEMTGIGESLGDYKALSSGTWGTQVVEPLKRLQDENDLVVEKNRDNAFYGTQLDQILRTQGLNTLLFTGVNTDQCVATTMEDASFRDYNVLLIEDATGTSNPDFCKEAVLINTWQCWGFTTETKRLQESKPTQR
ncbi:isochorismatase [Aliidiomarina minuta]|uniref:Isochorismatase n=1 Tax=Aliidiomarina minuta TaxID=880057 RepID=A0A432W8V3_9GAMM|nr:isochorismatase family cysteine hydrolase [Aliidiomarina minuta]RUO26583.1 isochorismatase [Aliidiomarina minuta]